MKIKEAEKIIKNYNFSAEGKMEYDLAVTVVTQALKQGYTFGKVWKHSDSINVDHPAHYNVQGKKECIVEMEELFGKEAVIYFSLLSAYKYLYRHEYKSNAAEDIEKARWYLRYVQVRWEDELDKEVKDIIQTLSQMLQVE